MIPDMPDPMQSGREKISVEMWTPSDDPRGCSDSKNSWGTSIFACFLVFFDKLQHRRPLMRKMRKVPSAYLEWGLWDRLIDVCWGHLRVMGIEFYIDISSHISLEYVIIIIIWLHIRARCGFWPAWRFAECSISQPLLIAHLLCDLKVLWIFS